MIQRLILPILMMSSLISALNEKCYGQKIEPVRIEAIPKLLKWENTPKDFNIDNATLRITAGEKTDMFRDPNVTYNTDNAPKLLFDADADFVLSASITHIFAEKWDGGALVLIQDSLQWIKFCFEKDYTGAKRVVSVVTKGISDDCNSVAIKSNKVFYKIAKADNVITLYYSSHGTKWILVRHFTFDATAQLKLGFLAQSPTGKECTVKFSDIKYSDKKIKDPYVGE